MALRLFKTTEVDFGNQYATTDDNMTAEDVGEKTGVGGWYEVTANGTFQKMDDPFKYGNTTEVRTVDPDTGGEKGTKLARYDLIPTFPLEELANHFGRGASKYAERNWERGYNWSLSYAALQRHANAFWAGEDIDPETGSSHLTAVAWHAMCLLEFTQTHPEKDDRPRKALDGSS